ncbi:MAG: hypothetical protein JRN35_10200 [Nitrososphaerota archaeon]|nr:hypothetical protein [Nitrososphaerota archaeon]
MEGIILLFHLPERTPNKQHRKLYRLLYGGQTSSWKGKYRYHRRGMLDDVAHRKIQSGVEIVREEDAARLRKAIQATGATVEVRVVRLTPKDEKGLGLSTS